MQRGVIRRRASARRREGRPAAVGICWTKAGVGALAKLRHHESLVEVAPRFSGRGPAAPGSGADSGDSTTFRRGNAGL